MKISVKEFTKIDGNTTSYTMNGIQTSAKVRVEQHVVVLKNTKLEFLDQPHDEVLTVKDSRYKNYNAKVNSIILEDGLLYRKKIWRDK